MAARRAEQHGDQAQRRGPRRVALGGRPGPVWDGRLPRVCREVLPARAAGGEPPREQVYGCHAARGGAQEAEAGGHGGAAASERGSLPKEIAAELIQCSVRYAKETVTSAIILRPPLPRSPDESCETLPCTVHVVDLAYIPQI